MLKKGNNLDEQKIFNGQARDRSFNPKIALDETGNLISHLQSQGWNETVAMKQARRRSDVVLVMIRTELTVSQSLPLKNQNQQYRVSLFLTLNPAS